MSISWFNQFYKLIADTELSPWLEKLPAQLAQWEKAQLHGDFTKWQKLLSKLPKVESVDVDLKSAVSVGASLETDDYTKRQITGLLQQFKPWRKGPFNVHGVKIDTEWRSDWKWQRVLPHLAPLAGRRVLDVGCGSGYHLWRMRGEDAKLVVGIDPSQLFLIQFQAIKHFIPDPQVHLLPIGVDDLVPLKAFDTVFSMGVLYHRRSPIDFLSQLKTQLRKGGQLVLETLVVEGDENTVLMAGERYAQMRNVWFLPSTAALTVWLSRLGFSNIQVVDVAPTSLDEQRRTDWMDSLSLADFLDPTDTNKTIEGYPAPIRAIITANA